MILKEMSDSGYFYTPSPADFGFAPDQRKEFNAWWNDREYEGPDEDGSDSFDEE